MLLLRVASRQELLQRVIPFVCRRKRPEVSLLSSSKGRELLTWVQDLLRLAVAGTERRVQLEVVHVVQERRTNREEHVLQEGKKRRRDVSDWRQMDDPIEGLTLKWEI